MREYEIVEFFTVWVLRSEDVARFSGGDCPCFRQLRLRHIASFTAAADFSILRRGQSIVATAPGG